MNVEKGFKELTKRAQRDRIAIENGTAGVAAGRAGRGEEGWRPGGKI